MPPTRRRSSIASRPAASPSAAPSRAIAVKLVQLAATGAKLRASLTRELYEPPHELGELATSDLRALWLAVAKLPAR